MIRSMTGFASIGSEADGRKVNVTVKSVNHRFLDVVVKAPQSLGPVESRLRAIIQQKVTRGRVELGLGLESTAAPEREVVLDEALLSLVAAALESAKARGVISGGLTASDLLRIPQALEIRTKSADGAATLAAPFVDLIERAVVAALDALVAMRATEGDLIGADLHSRLAVIAEFVDVIAREAEAGQRQLEARLREKLADLPADLRGDPTAVGQEIVRFVTRSDIDEELVRMRSHLEHWRALSAGPEPCGRKLDFLIQEMNREINTMGSKVEGSRATEVVIAAKAELERIREQVQNVE